MPIDWDVLKWLVDTVPRDINKNLPKHQIQQDMREQITLRDGGKCWVCGITHKYGSNHLRTISPTHQFNYKFTQLHHIIPNGPGSPENVATLCIRCHELVHLALYVEGKWKWVKPI